jgi:tRNA-splicing ligase RtcB
LVLDRERLYMDLRQIDENVYEIPKEGDMRVPARVYASDPLLEKMQEEGQTLQQVRNAATLPGIRKHSLVLPDGHLGYGFPIGGVAATDFEDGVISPGAIGFDINCGVRLLKTNLGADDVRGREEELAERLYGTVPTGLGKGGYIDVGRSDLRGILAEGVEWMESRGHARPEDVTHCEEGGRLPGDPNAVPDDAINRGLSQVGSLGSGNHFLEVQRVTDVYDAATADAFGLREGGVVVMIHSGSRGLGHQTCQEYLRDFEEEYPDIVESLPDRQLAYAPIHDDLAVQYRKAMYAAANFAWANRQAMTGAVREVLDDLFGAAADADLVYDVCHNVAKEERHAVESGEERDVLVHRKGATRAFPPGHEKVPAAYRDVGQPVLIPGSMGTHSYVLAGGERSMELTFGSTAHGAGRLKSRTQAKNDHSAGSLQQELKGEGVVVRARSDETVAEEAPGAYKDVDEVVRVSDALGIGTQVARMRPMANIKG